MENDIFEDLLSDEGATGMIDPLNPEIAYNPAEDFENFQNNSSATRISSEESGYIDIHKDIMDDVKDSDNNNESDLVFQALRAKGINPDAVKVENENGEIEEIPFKDLSKEEQLSLINLEEDESQQMYDDRMNEIVDFFEQNDYSLQDFVKAVEERVINNLELNQQPVYTVDDFSDEELFLVDFRNRFGEDFSEDELLYELERAKGSPELFEKQVAKIRDNYKAIEQQAIEQEKSEKLAAEEESKNAYIGNMVNIARSVSDMHDTAELDDDDREELLQFMFDQDNAGYTGLNKALSDPETLFKVAWYIKHGDDVFNEIHKHYQSEISKLSKSQRSNKRTEAVVKEKPTQHTAKRPRRLEDLF